MGSSLHVLYVHGHLYLEWAEEMGVPYGIFTEGSVEKDIKGKKWLDAHGSRWSSLEAKAEDMMKGACWR